MGKCVSILLNMCNSVPVKGSVIFFHSLQNISGVFMTKLARGFVNISAEALSMLVLTFLYSWPIAVLSVYFFWDMYTVSG